MHQRDHPLGQGLRVTQRYEVTVLSVLQDVPRAIGAVESHGREPATHSLSQYETEALVA